MESDLAQGGYGRRQLFELIQNGADAMVAGASGEIRLVLTRTHLYCANVGAPIEDKGLNALLHAYLSVKRGDEIGRYGLGFKSVLGISNKPEFFSRSISFGFDPERALADIRQRIPNAQPRLCSEQLTRSTFWPCAGKMRFSMTLPLGQ
jgi:hypothetical protein